MESTTSQQSISWFKDQYRDGRLVIKPPYQRKPVWAERQKCYLVESVLLNLPIPEIYVQQTTSADGETTYAVVDGQQRIRTVLQFIGSELDPDQQEHNKFSLDRLPATSAFYGLEFADLDEKSRSGFYKYVFAVRYLDTDDEREVRDMFTRLNKFLTPLRPQELRNAQFTGPFVKVALKLADKDFWAENGIVRPAAIRRMGDIEFVSELLIGVIHGPQAGSASVIDEYYELYEDYDDEFPDQRRSVARFERTLTVIQETLPDIKSTRWSNKTDFYSLFVALAHLLGSRALLKSKKSQLRKELLRFADDVDTRQVNERARVREIIAKYTRAVARGANDKARRADRHFALTEAIESNFSKKK